MNIANLELCKELATLSGWTGTEHYHPSDSTWFFYPLGSNTHYYEPPAYDLGYLLRKLPYHLDSDFLIMRKSLRNDDWYIFGYGTTFGEDSIPENAACKLAIELFKSGVLKRDK